MFNSCLKLIVNDDKKFANYDEECVNIEASLIFHIFFNMAYIILSKLMRWARSLVIKLQIALNAKLKFLAPH